MKVSDPNVDNKLTAPTVEKDGTTVYKKLSVTNIPTKPESVINKLYLESYILNSVTDQTGDIKFRPMTSVPTGYLRCNGALVSKSTYSGLYSVIGDTFSYVSNLGAGSPFTNQYNINSQLTNNLPNAIRGTDLPSVRAYHDVLVTNGMVYSFSRYSGTSNFTDTIVATINSDGSLNAWTTYTVLPIRASYSCYAAFKNYVYMFGGISITGSVNTNLNIVYRRKIVSDGTMVNSWEELNNLPSTISKSQVIATKNKVYLLGGEFDGVSSTRVIYSNISDNGDLAKWLDGPSLPESMSSHLAILVKDRVYVIGGVNSSGVTINSVYYSIVDDDGYLGDWVKVTDFPETIERSAIVCSTNKIYTIGGRLSGVASGKIYSATINADGSLGIWTNGSTMTITTYGHAVFITNTKINIVAGYINGALSQRVYSITIPGGLNNYMDYYGDGVLLLDPTKFKLPDYKNLESNGLYAFIKT